MGEGWLGWLGEVGVEGLGEVDYHDLSLIYNSKVL